MTKLIDTNEIKDRLHKCDVRELEDYIYRLCDEIDRLRGVQTPQGKPVRVPVMVETGFGKVHSTEYFVILPVPEEVTVEAEVENGIP